MAEKDANYYYNKALEARRNGNDRLAQYMENYARQIDPEVIAQQQAEYEMRKQRQNEIYNKYVAQQEAQQAPSAQYMQNGHNKGVQNDSVGVNYANIETGEHNRADGNTYFGVGDSFGEPEDEDNREGGYIRPDNQGQRNYGVTYVDSQGNASDYVLARSKPYTGNKFQQASQAYYGGGIDWNTVKSNPVSEEELSSIGLFNPDEAAVNVEGPRLSWKQRLYPGLHGK